MNTAAIAPQTVDPSLEPYARPVVRVIAGGLCERRPLHARAKIAIAAVGADTPPTRRFEGLQGTPYGLSKREHMLAVAGGLLFALAALGCIML